jgi:ribosomal protein S6--L-glutamate ligase
VAEFALAVVQQLETLGVPVVNASEAMRRSRDKLRSLQLLAQHDVDIPRTAVVRSAAQIGAALRAVGGLPVVLKLRQGTQGIGVMLAETSEGLEAILHTLWSVGQDLLVQEFVAESRGRDVRALVVGDRVVAAMRRTAPAGDFRSNIHRGGSGRAVQLASEYEQAAVEAARIMGLGIAGVDLLESRSGPKVIEVNASPGFEGLEKATRRDLASEIIRHAESRARVRVAALRRARSG